MRKKVKAYIAQHKMTASGNDVVVGVSGGADSICLLFILHGLKKELGINLKAVHVNHMLRPEAGEDAAFVEGICRKWDIPLKIFQTDIAAYAREKGMSIEAAGRDYRYKSLRQEAGPAGRIAVAHHQGDMAETMLHNLFRGSGLLGLAGIRPVRDAVIRPLLCATRDEIEDYLEKHDIPHRHDNSNDEDIYTRNRIRHQIIPLAVDINAAAITHMAQTAETVREAEEYLQKKTQKAYEKCLAPAKTQRRGAIAFSIKKLSKQELMIKKRILLTAIEKLLPGRTDILACHVHALLRLLSGDGSKKIPLPHGITAQKAYDNLLLFREEAKKEIAVRPGQARAATWQITADNKADSPRQHQKINIPGWGQLSYRIFTRQDSDIIPIKKYTKWFDYDKITTCVLIRKRLPGDFLVVNRDGGHKKLKDYLINEKIPKETRDEMYVLADASHVVWVPGLRISEHYKVTDETKTIFEVIVGDTYPVGDDAHIVPQDKDDI